jgi:DNA polymerase-3 subunit beta
MTATASPTTTTLSIARQSLKTALGKLATAVDTSSKAHDLAKHVRLDVAPGRLTLTATDFEAFVRLHVPCEADGEASVLLPAKTLAEFVSSLPPVGAVTLVVSATRAVLSAGRARFELAGMNAGEFPELPEVTGDAATVEASTFLDAIARAVTHASTEDVRASLNVVRLEPVNGQLLATGIDGPRMARFPAGRLTGALTACSLHRTSVPLLARLFAGMGDTASLRIAQDEHRCQVSSDDATAILRLVDLPFPNLAPIVARVKPTRVVCCDRIMLASAIRRVALASGPMRRIELTIAEEITVRAAQDALGNAVDVVGIDEIREGDATPLTIRFSATYALAALDVLTAQTVAIATQTSTLPILVRAADQAADDPTLVLASPLAGA